MKRSLLYLSIQMISMASWADVNGSIDCSLPCGAEQLITCAAQEAGLTAEQYYNTVLFNTANLDGFCKNPPGGSQTSDLQKYYFKHFCESAGAYFSYANFIQASSTPIFNQTGNGFGCVGDKNLRYKELSNFLTTIAQETTSVNPSAPYTNDGLFFRYENGAALFCSTAPLGPVNVLCSAPDSVNPNAAPYTGYYPLPGWLTDMNSNGESYTQTLAYFPGSTPYQIYNIAQTPETIGFSPTSGYPVAPGDTAPQLNSAAVISPGLWVGMGAKQLTGPSMFEYFGWYQSNLASPTKNYANFSNFVTQFLNDGVLGFQGAMWYWMFRVNGYGYRPIHTMVTDLNTPVCSDIAAVTRMVNGACNNYNPGRLTYYTYFNRVFHQPTTPVTCTTSPGGVQLNSLVCDVQLQQYCQTSTPGACT